MELKQKIEGNFKTDIPDVAETAFTDDELKDMRKLGVNVNSEKERIVYAKTGIL